MVKVVKIIGAVILLCSAGPLGFGLYSFNKTGNFLEDAVKVSGSVVELAPRDSGDGKMYYPVFSFEDLYGHARLLYSGCGSYPPKYDIGDTVSILYNPNNPKEARIDSFMSLWVGSIIGGILGGPIAFMGILLLFAAPVVIRKVSNEGRTDKGSGLRTEDETGMNENKTKDAQTRNWKIACHLASLVWLVGIPFGNIIGPLIVWLVKKDELMDVDIHGKESVNFQISMTLYTIVSVFLCFILIGFLILPVLITANVILVIIASSKANSDELYQYPFTIRLIK